ncbi:MAG: ABC transporter permease subunit [Candidatus Humimicrobiaceae bacterium]
MEEPKKVELADKGRPNIFRGVLKIPEIGMLIPIIAILLIFFAINPIYPLPEFIKKYGSVEPFGTSGGFLIFIVLIIAFDQILRRTVYGRKTYATGGNREVAKIVGIN